jgi:DNA-binding CsgD family transcriptional regulator
VCGSAHDIFAQSIGIVVVTPIDRRAVPTAELLTGLFDLTPAEARVARAIGAGQAVEEIATALGTTRETVRSQIKAVLGKTGTSRQAELASLLSGATIRR